MSILEGIDDSEDKEEEEFCEDVDDCEDADGVLRILGRGLMALVPARRREPIDLE